MKNIDYLKKLVIETIVWRFDTKTALEYIEKIGGKKISERYYFKIKKYVSSDQEIDDWITEHMRIGFALTHKMDIEELSCLKSILLENFYHETSLPYFIPDPSCKEEKCTSIMMKNPNYNLPLVIKLTTQIVELTTVLADMYATNPMVLAIKQKMKQDLNSLGLRQN